MRVIEGSDGAWQNDSLSECVEFALELTLKIIHYPHPTLAHKSSDIRRVDSALKNMVGDMFQLMYEANGVGLAANQVDLPLRLFIVNLKADPEEGEELVFINPKISKPKGSEEQEEGCLSIPGVYGNVIRPKTVCIEAYSLEGQLIQIDADGLLARVVQHENDHLAGVLFTDRMSDTGKMAIAEELADFRTVFLSKRETGAVPDDEELARQRGEWERRYCE